MRTLSMTPPTDYALRHCACCDGAPDTHTPAEIARAARAHQRWEQAQWEALLPQLTDLREQWALADAQRGPAVWTPPEWVAEEEARRRAERRARRVERVPAPRRAPEPNPEAQDRQPSPITQQALEAAADAPTMLEAALGYASLGIPVLPLWHLRSDLTCACDRRLDCPAPGKHPRIPSGSRGATTQVREIRAWWTVAPHAGIGLATGHGLDAIDCDGVEALAQVRDLHAAERLPQILATQRSGREGGVHLIVASSGAGNRSTGIEHVDFRGAGGYVVAAPTMHQSGRRYEWTEVGLGGGDGLAGALVDAPAQGWPWEGSGQRRAPSQRTAPLTARAHLQVQAEDLAAAGEGRTTTTLHRATSRMAEMVRLGALTAMEVTDALSAAYSQAGGSKSADEVRRRIAASLDAPVGLPRWAEGMTLDELVHGREALRSSVSTTVEALAAAHLDPASPTFVRDVLERDVLHALLTEADARGSLRLTMSRRHLAGLMGRVHRDGVTAAVSRLEQAGLLTEVRGSRLTGEAGRLTLSTRRLSDSGPTSVGTTVMTCPIPGQPSRREGGGAPPLVARFRTNDAVVGAGRGQARGLTRTDASLLRAAPTAGEVMRTAEWAARAGVVRSTASAALVEEDVSLASLGFVKRAGRGLFTTTPWGAAVAADLRADEGATGEALRMLERDLGVEGAQRRVEQSHAAAAAVYAARFAPVLLSRVVAGVLWDDAEQHEDERARASVSDLPRLKRALGPVGQWESLLRALRILDGQGGQEVRRAAATVVRSITSGKPAADAEAVLEGWLTASPSEEPGQALWTIRRAAEALRGTQGPDAGAEVAARVVAGRRVVREAGRRG